MRRSKLLYALLLTLTATLLFAAFAFASSAEDTQETVYTSGYDVTTSKGTTHIEAGDDVNLSTLYTSGVTKIKLYSDLKVTKTAAGGEPSVGTVVLDLNGKKLISAGGRIALAGKTLTVKNGTITSLSADEGTPKTQFVYGTGTAKLVIENCTIKGYTSYFAHWRGGDVTINNCTIDSTESNSAFVWSHNQSTKSNITFNNLTVESLNRPLISLYRYSDNTSKIIMLNNVDISSSRAIISITDSTPSEDMVCQIKVTGDSKIKLNSKKQFSTGATATLGTIGFAPGVKLSANDPVITGGNLVCLDNQGNIDDACTLKFAANQGSDSEAYPYITARELGLPVNPQFALTLYTDFTMNLCFSEEDHEKVVGVKVNGADATPVLSDGIYMYRISGIAPQNAATMQQIELTVNDNGVNVTKNLKYSVMDYANALIKSGYSKDSKQMVCRTVDFIKAVCEYAAVDVPKEVSDFVVSEGYKANSGEENITSVPESDVSVEAIKPFISGAQIVFDTTGIRFRFFLKENIGDGELKVTSKTFEEDYTVENSLIDGKNYFDVNLRAYDFYDGKIQLTYGEYSGSYDFRAYANSEAVKESDDALLETLVVAAYNYFREANEYISIKE